MNPQRQSCRVEDGAEYSGVSTVDFVIGIFKDIEETFNASSARKKYEVLQSVRNRVNYMSVGQMVTAYKGI